jgi:hypothetical protein
MDKYEILDPIGETGKASVRVGDACAIQNWRCRRRIVRQGPPREAAGNRAVRGHQGS